MAAISYKKGKKRIGELINVPSCLAEAVEKDSITLIHYIQEKDSGKYQDVEILNCKILLNQRVLYNGSELLLRSCSEAWNAKELYLPKEGVLLLQKVISGESVSEQETDTLNEMLLKKLEEHYPIYRSIYNRILECEKKIQEMSVENKKRFARETIKILQVSGQFADYKKTIPELGLNDSQGRLTNRTFNLEQMIFIDQSVTGFYERRTKIWNSEQS